MLTIDEAVLLVNQQKATPLQGLWRDYDVRQIPFVVYNDDEAVYIGHPNPPKEHPPHLAGATSIDINGIQTATLPVTLIAQDEQTFVPIAYHEGFHAYQHHHFVRQHPDFFMAMSHYPDFDAEYRTLCQLESVVLQQDWQPAQKLKFLATLALMRRERLAHHDSLLGYERFMERNEGTASYIEQKARQLLYGIPPRVGDVGHGWSRFYQIGAAVCWHLDETLPDWKVQVEAGASPSDLIIPFADPTIDLSVLDAGAIREAQTHICKALLAEVTAQIDQLQLTGVLRIGYRGIKQVFRAFNPSTMISLGDGRVLHRPFFQLMMPPYGKVTMFDGIAIDDIVHEELLINISPVQEFDGRLFVDAPSVQIDLTHITKTGAFCYTMRGDE